MKGTKSKRPEVPRAPLCLPPCKVCGEPGTGFHYGVTTCVACKGFFQRSLSRTSPFECQSKGGAGRCTIGQETERRKSCPKCRLDKCYAVGMSKDAIKTGRYSYEKKSKDYFDMLQMTSLPQFKNTPSPQKKSEHTKEIMGVNGNGRINTKEIRPLEFKVGLNKKSSMLNIKQDIIQPSAPTEEPHAFKHFEQNVVRPSFQNRRDSDYDICKVLAHGSTGTDSNRGDTFSLSKALRNQRLILWPEMTTGEQDVLAGEVKEHVPPTYSSTTGDNAILENRVRPSAGSLGEHQQNRPLPSFHSIIPYRPGRNASCSSGTSTQAKRKWTEGTTLADPYKSETKTDPFLPHESFLLDNNNCPSQAKRPMTEVVSNVDNQTMPHQAYEHHPVQHASEYFLSIDPLQFFASSQEDISCNGMYPESRQQDGRHVNVCGSSHYHNALDRVVPSPSIFVDEYESTQGYKESSKEIHFHENQCLAEYPSWVYG